MRQLILNVDDFEPQRHARSSILRAAGFDVIEARNGRQALSLIRERRPVLVVLDIHLPDIDGLEVCRNVKADPETAGVLVLHVSATFIEAGARVQALENGADAYLPEPLDPKELVAQVRSLLRLAAAETEARQALRALEESQELVRSFFDADGVLRCVMELQEDDIVFLRPNANLAAFYGKSVEEMSGRSGRDLGLPEDVIRQWIGICQRCRTKGRPTTAEVPLTSGSRTGWYHATVSFLPSELHSSSRFAITSVDISKRKGAEERLRISEERLRLAEEAGGVGIFDWDLSTGQAVWTPELATIYGMPVPADGMERAEAWKARLHPDDRERITGLAARWLASSDRELQADYRCVRPGGEVRWVAARSVAIRDGEGRALRVISTNIDVTERKRVEQELREALDAAQRREAEIETIYDSAPIGLCVLDQDGRYVRINRRLAAINGQSPQAHIGRSLREIVPGIAEQAEALLREVVTTGQPVRGVEIMGEVPGQPGVIGTWIENWHPIKDRAGAIVGVNVGVEDVTRLKQIERKLREANQVKDEFLATLSHELRTPLTAILGWAELLQQRRLSEATERQALEAIARNAESQRQLIADVLDVSRMVAGKLRLEMVPMDLVETLRLTVESMRPAADERGVHLEFFSELPTAIAEADAARVQQVVWNLLSNAIKFTPSGGRVTVIFRGTGSAYELIVRDTGVGIRPDFLPRVFDRFSQADSSTTRRHTGLGLGLSIVRQLVELHGGEVSVSSDGEDMGATFRVAFPLPKRHAAAVAPDRRRTGEDALSSDYPLAGVRVLIVDDLEDARLLCGQIIQEAGGVVTLAASGDEAFRRLSEGSQDVIVADIAMPRMDGYEFMGRVRSLPVEAGGGVPAIALTAYGSPDDEERSRGAGFSGHLCKPLGARVLVSAILAALGRTPSNREPVLDGPGDQ